MPVGWVAAQPIARNLPELVAFFRGRDPDLGRHLALLSTIRI